MNDEKCPKCGVGVVVKGRSLFYAETHFVVLRGEPLPSKYSAGETHWAGGRDCVQHQLAQAKEENAKLREERDCLEAIVLNPGDPIKKAAWALMQMEKVTPVLWARLESIDSGEKEPDSCPTPPKPDPACQ